MTGAGMPTDDAIWRDWMEALLSAAAGRFGLTVTGLRVWGWRDRSMAEWEEGPRRVRAEVMTLVPGHPCSPDDMLTTDPGLPQQWWPELRRSLLALAAAPTSRECVTPNELTGRLSWLGADIDLSAVRWETVHGDLHWANLVQPQFAILDWEWWGRGPVGLDAATLYCYSLLAPATAQRVHDTFRDILSSPEGVTANLYVCARLLSRAERGDHPQLAPLLRRHAYQLADGASR